jgi:hypothetical protein
MIYLDGDTFTLSDFERSATAKRLKIENKLEGDDILDYQFLIDKVFCLFIKSINNRYMLIRVFGQSC